MLARCVAHVVLQSNRIVVCQDEMPSVVRGLLELTQHEPDSVVEAAAWRTVRGCLLVIG